MHFQWNASLATFQHPKCALQAWTLEGLCAFPGIDDQLDEFQVVELGVGLHLGALGIEADAAVGLLVGRNSQVGDGPGRHESDVRSLGVRVKQGGVVLPMIAKCARILGIRVRGERNLCGRSIHGLARNIARRGFGVSVCSYSANRTMTR